MINSKKTPIDDTKKENKKRIKACEDKKINESQRKIAREEKRQKSCNFDRQKTVIKMAIVSPSLSLSTSDDIKNSRSSRYVFPNFLLEALLF